jgi:hypothetical protein
MPADPAVLQVAAHASARTPRRHAWIATLWAGIALLFLAGCSTLVQVPAAPQLAARGAPIDAYARVLKHYVNARGEVDFGRLQTESADLDVYVRYIAHTPASALPDSNARLAHYLNSYNALSMYNVLASGIPDSHAGFAKVNFFYLRKLVIGGRELSLYDYENQVIRPLGDARVHFALNCSALGCPVLPRVPFTGDNIDAELERETRLFFAETRNLRVDHTSRTVHLSELLDFYTEDFISPATPSLLDYVNRYAPTPVPLDYAVEFIDYDWTVANSRRH